MYKIIYNNYLQINSYTEPYKELDTSSIDNSWECVFKCIISFLPEVNLSLGCGVYEIYRDRAYEIIKVHFNVLAKTLKVYLIALCTFQLNNFLTYYVSIQYLH